jgi:hypothetical protein
VFQSGYHRLTFFFGLASVATWAYIFNEWGLNIIVSVVLAIPVGFVFALAGSMAVGSLRQVIGDTAGSWLPIVGGIALLVWAVLAFERATLALVALSGASLAVGGIGLLYMRLNAMRSRAAMGEASEEDVDFLASLDR